MDASCMTDPEIRRAISGKGLRAAVIPVGSTEQHGAHLAVSADSDIAVQVSSMLCRRACFLLCPAIMYGSSYEHAPRFNVSTRPATLRRVIAEAAESLGACGIRCVFVINGHHGNQAALKGLKRRAGKARVFALSYWHFMGRSFDHAGFAETSLVLAASPKKAKMSRARRGFAEPEGAAAMAKAARLASKSFMSVAQNGVWGDPRGASAQAGRRMLAEIAENLRKECLLRLAGPDRR